MTDYKAMAAEVVQSVREFVVRATVPIAERVDGIEQRVNALPAAKDGAPGVPGKDGIDGKDAEVDYTQIWRGVSDLIAQKIAALPGPKDGEKGADAVVDYDKIGEIISLAVAKAVAAVPVPKDGKDADPVDYAQIAVGLKHLVGDAVAALPKPKDGTNADPSVLAEIQTIAEGAAMRADAVLEEICTTDENVKGLRGEVDALNAAPKGPQSLLINESGELVAVYPDGETKTIGVARGKDGIRGASIMDGSVDDSGQLVLRMSDGRIINAGIVKGERGKDGSDGKGIPGRDANELRVLPAIDEAKSYPEGTSALYRGGEIRAERTTDPIVDGDILKAGWRVAREGIAEETETDSDDGRVIERTTIYTSGRTFTRRITTRAMVYRGINKTDVQYERGDVTTFDGQLWHCNESTSDRPGISHAWQLCTRKGRDGKPGDSVKGDPGQPGKPGRDLTQMGPNGTKY